MNQLNPTLSINDLNISDSYFFIFVYNINTEIFFGSTKRQHPLEVTFIGGQNLNVSSTRVHIQEYLQYGANPPDSSIDPNEAFYNVTHILEYGKMR